MQNPMDQQRVAGLINDPVGLEQEEAHRVSGRTRPRCGNLVRRSNVAKISPRVLKAKLNP
jgi:hypothetical protein